MNESIMFVQNWLIEGEIITHHVDEILWYFKPCYPQNTILPSENTPAFVGCIALTNRRLIIIEQNKWFPIPEWYSVTGIASLSERPPKYKKDRKGFDYPYQALLTLYSGIILVLESPKDKVEERGRNISTLLVNALFRLNSGHQAGHIFSEYIEQYEEQRRRNNDYQPKRDNNS